MTTELIRSKGKRAAVANKLKGHDKSGIQGRSKLMFATPAIGVKATDTSAGLRGNIGVLPSSTEAQRTLIAFYKKQGYVRVGPREFKRGDEPILVIPKKSKMIRLKTGKAGRAMQRESRSGIII